MTEHTHGRFKATHHKFVFNNMSEDNPGGTAICADTVAEQSRKQIRQDPQQKIIVHHHRSTETCDGSTHDAYGCSLASQVVG